MLDEKVLWKSVGYCTEDLIQNIYLWTNIAVITFTRLVDPRLLFFS